MDANIYRYLVTGDVTGFHRAVSRIQVAVSELECPNDKSSVLHIAAFFGQVHVVDDLLNNPQSRETSQTLMLRRNLKGDIPIHSAVKSGKSNTVEAMTRWMLQQHEGSNVTQEVLSAKDGDGNTALHIALQVEEVEMAGQLLGLYPRALFALNEQNICPLYLAVRKDFCKLVEKMLNSLVLFREDANRCLRQGKSLLHAAISAKKIESLRHLLESDVELNISHTEEGDGLTPMSYAGRSIHGVLREG